MKKFCTLFEALDGTTKSKRKIELIGEYFAETPPEDAIWGLFFLSGRKLGRAVSGKLMRQWLAEEIDIPEWVIEESYHRVGDSSETLALLSERLQGSVLQEDLPLHEFVNTKIKPIKDLSLNEQREAVLQILKQSSKTAVFITSKMLSGGLRVGVAQKTVVKALSQKFGIDENILALRLSGNWEVSSEYFQRLTDPLQDMERDSQALYPFCLAYPLEQDVESLGAVQEWNIEWKWDGIRAQLVRRCGKVSLWSRGEEIINEQFPEIVEQFEDEPGDIVVDGELLAWKGAQPLPFQVLQKRLGRKKPSASIRKKIPIRLLIYDLLELDGEDIRELPLARRRELLSKVKVPKCAEISEILDCQDWQSAAETRGTSREMNAEGLMLKPKQSPYVAGRRKGSWLKWKVEPFTLDGVLLYAQRGSGKRAGLYSDFTLGIWKEDQLVPIAKAYSGLTDKEISEVTRFVNKNTTDRFGPVRSVQPELVFELAFEGVSQSNRHKSGYALRFPRIIRWRRDLKPRDADSVELLEQFCEAHSEVE